MSASSAAQMATGTATTQHQSGAGDKAHPLTSGHSGRLVYAKPQDLPSFPSLGLKEDGAAASAAASLGWANQKPIKIWTPDKSTSASKAALLANDFKMAPQWQPEPSSAGSKAATFAAENALRTDNRFSVPANMWGNSAANQAFQAGRNAPQLPSSNTTRLSRQDSMSAAKGAMTRGTRPRAKSNPLSPPKETYPGSANAAANALSAATLAHQPSTIRSNMVDIPAKDAGAVPVTKLSPQMYTSNPPVQLEVDEKHHEASLRASALAMAQTMYAHQQKVIDATKHAHSQGTTSRGRRFSADSSIDEPRPMQLNNLQEAAYKLAQERLSRLHEEHQKNRDYQEYYGNPTSPKKGFTLTKLRRRASSDGEMFQDRQQSEQIRNQMSMFSTKISEVDEQKRTKDREALLAAARRNVKAKLQGMDDKMYQETGRVKPSVLSEWELKAHAAAKSRSDARMVDHHGQVDIGGGKFIDQKAVDDIAASRVQPVLDEINEKAEAERERQITIKDEKDRQTAAKAEEKEHKAAAKVEEKEQKAAAKVSEKERQAMFKKQEKEEKERQAAVRQQEREKQASLRTVDNKARSIMINTDQEPSPSIKSPSSTEESPHSPTVKVKNWLKSHFSRPRAKSASTPTDKKEAQEEQQQQPGPGFIGGHALTRLNVDGSESLASLENGNTSIREVAMAGKPRDTPSPSSNRDSRFIEMIE